jgi:hypothetical protein
MKPLSRVLRAVGRVPILLTSMAVSAVGQTSSPDTRVVRLQLETDRPTYHVGDSIAVRVAYVNTSSTPIRFIYTAPWYAARLVISNGGGRAVKPTGSIDRADVVSTRSVSLGPKETQVQTWDLQEWFALSHWGYDLQQPGTYTIVGIPMLIGRGVRSDIHTIRSNRVTFTILP